MPNINLDERVMQMFVDKLITDNGGGALGVKQKEKLEQELHEALDSRMQKAMIRALPDAKLVELEKLLDEDASDEAIEELFAGAGVDFTPVLRKVLNDFRNDYFSGKVKTSIKISPMDLMKKADGEVVAGEVQNNGGVADKGEAVATVANGDDAAQPVQGTTSAMPGQSNVEGVAIRPAGAVPPMATPKVEIQTLAQEMQGQALGQGVQKQAGVPAGAQAPATSAALMNAQPSAMSVDAQAPVSPMSTQTPTVSATGEGV